jgi:hypothetical protein
MSEAQSERVRERLHARSSHTRSIERFSGEMFLIDI